MQLRREIIAKLSWWGMKVRTSGLALASLGLLPTQHIDNKHDTYRHDLIGR